MGHETHEGTHMGDPLTNHGEGEMVTTTISPREAITKT